MSAPGSSVIIPGVTGTGNRTALVTIQITSRNPLQKVLIPPPETPVQISFTYPKGTPAHERPHGIEWVAEGLLADERLEIRLDTRFPGYVEFPDPFHLRGWWENLAKLFPSADVLPSGAFGWELTSEFPSAVSGLAAAKERYELRRDGGTNRPLLRYEIVFFDADGGEHALDPNVDVEPDP